MKKGINKFVFSSLLIVFSISILSGIYTSDDKNPPTYPEMWKKIDSLEAEGLYRMAKTEVGKIFEFAAANQHHDQVIKSVLFELKYNSYLEEDDYIMGIARLDTLIKVAPSPAKEILHSLLAEVYWGYYSANMWKFSERTSVAEVDLADVRTWDLKRIAIKIRDHYVLSLFNESASQSKEIKSFSEIITSGYENEGIRPTVYDFLAHRALDFFSANTFALAGPAETFVMDDPAYFQPNSLFLHYNAVTNDSLNTRFLAVRVMHALTQFHSRKNNLKPLFYLELERLNFAQNYATLPHKKELYYAGLERLADAYKAHDFSSEAWYQIALYHSNLGNDYNPLGDTTARWEKKVAHEICLRTIKQYPNAFGSRSCASLISIIERKNLSLSAENVIIPDEESKFLLEYENINEAHIKVVPFDYKKLESGRLSTEKLYKMLRQATATYKNKVNLVDPKDYNKHSIELLIPKLKSGFYYILVSSDGSFDEKSGGFALVPFWVSDITHQVRNLGKYNQVMVSERKSGKPLIGATVEVYYQQYNYDKRNYEKIDYGTYTTDDKGQISFLAGGDYRNYSFTIRHGDETFAPDGHLYSYPEYEESEHIQTHFFTDRKIYRPGQTIYFKGIMVRNKGKERELLKNQSSHVYFYDVNGQEVKSVAVTTNQFGSFEGSFIAPFGVLTGQMTITNSYGSTSFRVEEYKRPKFNIEMKPVEGEFQVNDSIVAKGVAKAFAGNYIDGASVKYRVVRSVQYDWGYWWYWRPQAEPKEIANGTLVTDENGAFEVVFKAIPDKESDPKSLPIFTYTVYADVTDINGETHSASSSVQAGYQSLRLSHNLAADMDANADFFLRLSTTNLNGQKIEASGTLKIDRLKTPNQPYYNRLWHQPDMKNWSETEFNALFPNQVYGNEAAYQNWPTDKQVFETQFNTAITDSIALKSFKNWTPGVYRYEAVAKDKNGIEVKNTYYFTVFNSREKSAPNNEVLWVKSLQNSAEPGEVITVLLGTAETDLIVNFETEANGKLIESKTITLTKEQRKLEFKIEEAYRGNFTIHFSAIKNNRHFSETVTIFVPYTNKELDLSFSTFRNKLLPGEAEEWVLNIKNKYGEKEQAELLATLYDASLDDLYTPNSFYMNIYQTFYGNKKWNAPDGMQMTNAGNVNYYWNEYAYAPNRYFPALNYFGWSAYYYGYSNVLSAVESISYEEEDSNNGFSKNMRLEGGLFKDAEKKAAPSGMMDTAAKTAGDMDDQYQANEQSLAESAESGETNTTGNNANLGDVKARSNFNETAFFYPQLTTDANGDVKIKFTIPESLTKWRFLGLAHTQDLKIGTISEEVITQKDLMVVPNAPRFLREGDMITISAKISNISETDLMGQAQLSLYDPFTEKQIDEAFDLKNAQVSFTAEKGKSTVVSWTLKVPYTQSAVKYKIVAKAGNFSDGEENVLPILSNRMLVTESLPMPVRGKEVKTFNFDKLINSGASKTLKHHSFTLEFTSNPAWYAIQAMPYMMEYPHECAEQTFTRYYSNAIASHIMNSNPKIKKVIEDWGQNSPEAFLSNLQKNQELKAVILEETPWVLDGKNEEESKRNLAVLLDMKRMSGELEKALDKTLKTQSSNGAWPWFPGMPESRYITQHIVTGMGHLDHLGIKDVRDDRRVWNMIEKAVRYLDGEIERDFKYAKKWDTDYLKNQHIGYDQIQYLYARSYFPSIGMNNGEKEAVSYYQNQANTYWLKFNIYAQGMIGLAAHRFEMAELATKIVKSLKDRSIQHEEFGMYWKDYQLGYYWYEAPIETQALMIELFDEVANDQLAVEELKIWLLKQKQTTNWKTTKQTTEAVYALLLKGTDLLASDELVSIKVGGKAIEYKASPDKNDAYQVKSQAGTGYFKTAWKADEVKPEMGKIEVSKNTQGVAWGAAYWQYFEDLDKITFAETNLKLNKQLFLVEVTNQGEQLKPINDKNVLEVGQKVRVRVELRTDRNLEYVHMKDMRASGFEPIDVLSRYHYRDGLGYYQSTKDAATHFFFDYIPKGTYVFEYDLRVQHKGDFSNGITSIQCMYAPEFTSHSDGIRVMVK